MSQGTQYKYSHALGIARRMTKALQHSCHRLMIVGSVRRCKQMVGDIELLAVTKRHEDMFGCENGPAFIDTPLQRMIDSGELSKPIKNGDRYKQFIVTSIGMKFDLFIVPADEWAVALAIRTGPRDFSRRIVTERHRHGLLQDGHMIEGNKLWRKQPAGGRSQVIVESENQFLQDYCGGFVFPQKRI
jgi:DNA polymerase/3'-5' exonuclease PolX